MTEPVSAPSTAHRRTFRLWLGGISVLALAIRVGHALTFTDRSPVGGDAYFYHHGANLLADGYGFIVPYDFLEFGIRTEAADHPPLFMGYLAAWSTLGMDSQRWHLFATALLGVATVVAVGFLGRKVAGDRVGLVAAGLAAVSPNLFGWDAMLLSEPAATLTAVVATLLVYTYRERPVVAVAAAVGGAIGLAALTRAELLALSVLVVVPAVAGRGDLPWRTRVGHLVAAGAACVAVIGPWVGFNLSRFDRPVYLSSGLEITMAYSNCDSVYFGPLIGYWDFSCALAVFAGRDDYDELDQSERSVIWRDHVGEYMDDHRDRVPKVVAARVGRVAGLFRPGQQIDLDALVEGRARWVAHTGMLTLYPLAVAAIAGAVLLGRRGIARYPLVAPFVVVTIATAMAFGATRYRAAAEPFLCLLAAVAVVATHDRLRDVRASS